MKKLELIFLTTDGQQALDVFLKDPFHYFNLNGLATDPVMRETAASLYQMLQIFIFCILVISTVWAVIKWGITPPAKKQEGILSIIGWKTFLVIFTMMFLEIVGFFYLFFDRMAAQAGPG